MRQEFREDVEGLRALAVAPILLFHLNPSWCPGGFAGVDVFFVISGYLITQLILSDGAGFSWRKFYVRRFFRLFPALLVTLIGTVAAGYWLLDPAQYVETAKTALASALGVSNFYFLGVIDYFNSSSLEHPLLHTWSLGLEEQFYVVWPALLWLVRKAAVRLQTLALLVGAMSLALVAAVHPLDPQATFYMMPFRMFEFAIGAAVIAARQKSDGAPAWLVEPASWGAVAAIAISLFAFDGQTAWPGPSTLVPVLATATLLLFGDRCSAGAILRLRPVRYLGRISYSLYLVHWPLIVLYRMHAIVEPELPMLLVLGMGSLALGSILHHGVEKPFRLAPSASRDGDGTRVAERLSARHAVPALISGAIALLLGCASVLAHSGYPARLDRHRVQFVDKGLTYAGDLCSSKRFACVFGDRSSPKTVYLVGDSHALNLLHGLDSLLASRGLKGVALYDHGCLFAEGTVTYVGGAIDAKCAKNVAQAYDYLAGRSEPVIIAMNYPAYAATAADAPGPLRSRSEAEYLAWLRERLGAGISRLGPDRRPVIIVKQNYDTGINLPRCLSRPGVSSEQAERECVPRRRDSAFQRTERVDRMIDALVQGLPGAVAIDPKRGFCSEDECRTRDADRLFFRDTDHLTNEGSLFLVDRLKDEFLAALEKRR